MGESLTATTIATYYPKHKIHRGYHALVALIILLAVSQTNIITVEGDFYGPNHDSAFFGGNWRGYSVCSICHGGLTYDAEGSSVTPVEVSDIFENYRCAACHMTVTRTLVEDTLDSAHNVVSCTYCHDTHHEGHTRWMGRYSTTYRGLYGCYGCHKIVTQDYYPPSNPSVYFTVAHPGTDTAYISFSSKKVVFNPSGYSATMGIYPATFIDPATGSFADIPSTNRYWMCLRCHFVQEGSLSTTTTQATSAHPDLCYYCHSLSFNDPHNITKDNDFFVTTACTSCHNAVGQAVASSIHSSIGCRCHSVEHMSRYNGSAAWVFVFAPEPGDYVTPALPADFLSWLNPFYYNAATNASALGVNVYPIDTGTGTPYYLNMTYVLRDGDASLITGKAERLMTCFNCHFVADGQAQAALEELLRGYVSAPNLDPHSIRPQSSTSTGDTVNNAPSGRYQGTSAILLIAIGVTALVLLLLIFSGVRFESR